MLPGRLQGGPTPDAGMPGHAAGQADRYRDWAADPPAMSVGEATKASMDAVRVATLGEVGGYEVWLVDGTRIRDEIDIDYVGGGNPERYQYIPAGEIWLESTLSPGDYLPIIIHEVYEAHLMALFDMTYEDAHTRANEWEKAIRWSRSTWAGEDPIAVAQELIADKLPDAGREHEEEPESADDMLLSPDAQPILD